MFGQIGANIGGFVAWFRRTDEPNHACLSGGLYVCMYVLLSNTCLPVILSGVVHPCTQIRPRPGLSSSFIRSSRNARKCGEFLSETIEDLRRSLMEIIRMRAMKSVGPSPSWSLPSTWFGTIDLVNANTFTAIAWLRFHFRIFVMRLFPCQLPMTLLRMHIERLRFAIVPCRLWGVRSSIFSSCPFRFRGQRWAKWEKRFPIFPSS